MKDRLKTSTIICFWCNLLRYASSFVQSNWRLDTPDAINNLERIESLKDYFTSVCFYPIEKLLVLNDGFIRNVDIIDLNEHIFIE